MVVLEVCVESVPGARAARSAGAQRVELCCALGEGGLTPGTGSLRSALELEGLEVIVLARPRGGDFLYSEVEFGVLERDVECARELGAAGVALGCLSRTGEIDRARCARLIARAGGLPVTFHRAFDLLKRPLEALEILIDLGVARLLTSGQAPSALEGAARIAELVSAASGRIEVIAAGGVRASNARALVEATGVPAVHAALSARRESEMVHRNALPRLSAPRATEEYAHWETDPDAVRALLAALE